MIDQALANNRDLRIAVANIAAARAQYHVQRAALFPTVTANASATYGQEPASVPRGGAGGARPIDRVNQPALQPRPPASAAYELDLFGRVRNLTHAAQEQYFATGEARDAAQISLVAEVATDYLTLRADRGPAGHRPRHAGQRAGQPRPHPAPPDAGVASGLDVAQARDHRSSRPASDVAHLTTQVAQDRNALELVVGAPVADADLPAGR